MRQSFEQAKHSAPSLLILEEIDAVASARGPMSHDHKVEELTEILRMIESAAKNGVLVLATTNRKEALDPAVLRTGRFDHSVLVDYPTKMEVELALQGMLKKRPHDPLELSETSHSLAGRPMSDAGLGRERGGEADRAGETGQDHARVPAGGIEPAAGWWRRGALVVRVRHVLWYLPPAAPLTIH